MILRVNKLCTNLHPLQRYYLVIEIFCVEPVAVCCSVLQYVAVCCSERGVRGITWNINITIYSIPVMTYNNAYDVILFLSRALSLSLSLCLWLTLSLALSLSHASSLLRVLLLSLARSRACAHTLSLFLPFSLSLFLPLSLTHKGDEGKA